MKIRSQVSSKPKRKTNHQETYKFLISVFIDVFEKNLVHIDGKWKVVPFMNHSL